MPQSRDTRWWGWGYQDQSFPLASPRALWTFLERRLGELARTPPVASIDEISLPATRLSGESLAPLREIVGSENVSIRPEDRVVHSLGKSYADLFRIRNGDVPNPTDVVVYPESEPQIESLLRLAQNQGWVVMPFGGGTSVVGGVEPPPGSRPVVTVDLRRMNRVLEVDRESRRVTVECGIRGPDLESRLNDEGFTLGHFPQSFEFSTLGGWIATRSSGHSSTRYGNIENIVRGLRVVTPRGTMETASAPAAAAGPGLLQLLIGSEGAYGFFTRATLVLETLPQHRRFPSFLFPSFEEGAAAVRKLLQTGLRPAVMRLSDEDETELWAVVNGSTVGLKNRLERWRLERKGLPFPRVALLVLGFEAPGGKRERARLRSEVDIARVILQQSGGHFVGEGPGTSWYRRRFRVPYLRDLLMDRGVMVDTVETAASWKSLMTLHRALQRTLKEVIEAEGEAPLVTAHLSHGYPDGASLYYTFLARQKPGRELAQWARVKRSAAETILEQGGALSHRHGIGTQGKPWLRGCLGEPGVEMIETLKETLDPRWVLNPETLVEPRRVRGTTKDRGGQFSCETRSANLARLSREEFDVAIIGGGITGAAIARDAALRGMSVALIDKGDFASGTSSRSSRMVHGGLRYLKQLDVHLVREALRERAILLRLAPHLVKPVPHLLPIYGGQRRQLEIQVGMMGYEMLAGERAVPPYEKLSRDEALAREPLLRRRELRGAFVYYDCLTSDSRLTLATIRSAAEHGAVVVNHTRCVALEVRHGTVTGARFEDLVGGVEGCIRARVVVNAAGPWADEVRSLGAQNGKIVRATKGVHLVVDRRRLDVRHVVVGSNGGERPVFVVPRGSFSYVGTTDTDHTGSPDDVRAEPEDVDYLLGAASAMFDQEPLSLADVRSTWAGLRPLASGGGSPSSLSRDYKIDVAENGLVTIVGGKLTTHRSMGERAVDEILSRFAHRFEFRFGASRTSESPLFGGEIAAFELYARGAVKGAGDRFHLTSRMMERLIRQYGTDYLKVLALGLRRREYLEPLAPGVLVLKGEVLHAVEEEMAMSLDDFMKRRTELYHFGRDGGLRAAREVVELMGERLGWDEAEKQSQLERYRNDLARSVPARAETAPETPVVPLLEEQERWA